MEELKAAVNIGDCRKLIDTCEIMELDESISPKCIAPAEVYACLMCAYIAESELENAKYLWKRIPSDVKSGNHLLTHVWNLAKCLWVNDYKGFYANAQNTNWPAILVRLIDLLKEKIRGRAFKLLSESYSHIAVQEAAIYLGLREDEAVLLVTEHGWVYDKSSHMLQPKPEPVKNWQETNVDFLENLTEFIVHLER